MMRSIRIRHFKKFDDLHVQDLARLTLIGGRNNVGKSTLLEAIFLYHDRQNPSFLLRPGLIRGVTSFPPGDTSAFAPAFHDYDIGQPIDITVDVGGQTHRLKILHEQDIRKFGVNFVQEDTQGPQPAIADRKVNGAEAVVKLQYFEGDDQTNSAALTLHPQGYVLDFENPEKRLPTTVFLGPQGSSAGKDNVARFGTLELRNQADRVVDFLRLISPELNSLAAITMPGGALLHADIGLRQKVPVNYLGDGLNRLLSVVLAMGQAEGGILLVDEIAAGLHYSIQPRFWRNLYDAAGKFNCQVIATTHSYECLQASHAGLQDQLRPEFCYQRLDEVEGHVSAKRYSYDALGAALENDWEVR